jgi:hypothetical protein
MNSLPQNQAGLVPTTMFMPIHYPFAGPGHGDYQIADSLPIANKASHENNQDRQAINRVARRDLVARRQRCQHRNPAVRDYTRHKRKARRDVPMNVEVLRLTAQYNRPNEDHQGRFEGLSRSNSAANNISVFHNQNA